MSKADKLRIVPPVRSAERETLADAIAEAAPVVAAVDKARVAAEAARGQLALAVGAVPSAERAVAAVKARMVEDPSAERAELRALRQAETDARDDVEIAREIAARAESALNEAERSARYAADKVASAAGAVVVACFAPALEAAERAGREFAHLAFAADAIAGFADHWTGEQTQLRGLVGTLNPQFVFRSDAAALEAAQAGASAPWRAAHAALLSDANAPLPRVG
jgi:hypothetical protein